MKKLLITISKKIQEEFKCPVYIEEAEKGIKTPSFFIYIVNSVKEDRNRWTYDENSLIQIVYFKNLKDESYKELDKVDVVEKLKELFSDYTIKVDEDIFNIKNITVEHTEDMDICIQLDLYKIGFKKKQWDKYQNNIEVMKEISMRESEV